jgi:hypothetical protein
MKVRILESIVTPWREIPAGQIVVIPVRFLERLQGNRAADGYQDKEGPGGKSDVAGSTFWLGSKSVLTID